MMRRRAGSGMGKRQASRPGARLRDHVGQRLERRIGAHQEDIGRRSQQRNRREVLEGIVGNFGIQERIGGVAAGDHDQGVAIGRRCRQRLRRNHPARPRPVLDDDRLAPLLRHHLAERARQDVDGAAGRIGHENPHRFGWKGLSRRRAGCGQRQRRGKANPEPSTHDIPSPFLSHLCRMAARRWHRHRPQVTCTARTC